MYTINLLPPERRRGEIDFKRLCALTAGLTAFFLLVAGGYGHWRLWEAERDLSAKRAAADLLLPNMERQSALAVKRQLARRRNKVLIDLSKQRYSTYAALAQLGAAALDGLSLDSLELDSGHNVVMRGKMRDPELAGLFLQRFPPDSLLTELKLTSTEELPDGQSFEFLIIGKIKD